MYVSFDYLTAGLSAARIALASETIEMSSLKLSVLPRPPPMTQQLAAVREGMSMRRELTEIPEQRKRKVSTHDTSRCRAGCHRETYGIFSAHAN